MVKGSPLPPPSALNIFTTNVQSGAATAVKFITGNGASAAKSVTTNGAKIVSVVAAAAISGAKNVTTAAVAGSAKVAVSLQPALHYAEANPHVLVGLAALLSIPMLLSFSSSKIQSSSWLYRFVFVAAFVANCVTVMIPGRFDGMATIDKKTGRITSYPWETLFAPAGWAFAIWGVIYIGELLVTLQVAAIGKPMQTMRKAAVFWAAGNLFQSLWCGVFRPLFKDALWLPMVSLALASASMLVVHSEITKIIYPWSTLWEKAGLIALRSPISLHAAWLTGAALLNLNAWATVSKTSVAFQTAVAYFSAYLAAIAGGFFAVTRGDPFIAFTVAWALAALSERTLSDGKVRAKNGKKDSPPLVVVESLALTESILSKAMIALGIAAPAMSRNLF